MESDRQEITVRLLHNGRYVWTIMVNTALGDPSAISKLKQMDGELANAFPNHAEKNSTSFRPFGEE